ncbi:hypothetical protein LCGC14_0722940 [marine sediment metagenome]|uniref:Uncharacterized protein n=1 Tax=marine sediment metagenome TaxID=412755 RepID=A0A0F9QBW4_9ZZZZ
MSATKCVHRWWIPDAADDPGPMANSVCRRCGARRQFPRSLPRQWSPIRISRKMLAEMNENMRTAERQAQ